MTSRIILQEKKIIEVLDNYPSDSEGDFSSDSESGYDMEIVKENRKKVVRITFFDENEDEEVEEIEAEVQVPGKELREELWYANKDNMHAQNPPPFKGAHSIMINGATPLDYFLSMFPPTLLDHIQFETIRYSHQCGKENFKLTLKDLYIYFGINIIMSYIKYPSSRMYWSSNKALRMDLIADSMSVNRFEEIKRYLHFVNNSDTNSKDDSFWKIRPVITALHAAFHEHSSTTEHQSIDEMIVPFKGRSRMKQYVLNKPHPWGFKIWVRANSNGYVNCFEMYQGKETKKEGYGPIGDAVVRLCHDIHGLNSKLFMDNLFTGLPLLRHLLEKDIFVIGTVRMNRVRKVQEKLKPGKVMFRGESTFATSSDNITILRWKDNKEVHMISSFAGLHPQDITKRWDSKTRQYIDVSRPYVIQQYNMYMGGVDLANRMIAHYPHGLKNKKWYIRIFFHFINIAIVNAWLCYKDAIENVSLLDFKSNLAVSLIQLGTVGKTPKRGRPTEQEGVFKKRKSSITGVVTQVRYDGIAHYPKKMEVNSAPRCHDSQCRSRTRFMCGKCLEPVCPTCMENFHKM